jgi:serine/threonine-protein kinase
VIATTMLESGVIVAGDFRIDGVVGDGGMGVVYRATQLSLERTVALKLITAALSQDIAFRERFRREGRIQANLEHPHIIDVYAAGESEFGLFLAMRLVHGPSLSDLVGTPGLTVHRTVRLLTQIASALDAAHDVGLIHRDIKPHNILIDQRRDHSYLADFGVTKARGTPGLTQVGQRVGTLAYMAPEQFRGQEATEESDIYALGGVVYESFVGTVPYPMPTEASIISAHLSEPVPRITEHRPELPQMLDDVIRKAMAKEPEDRYSSASKLMADVALAVGITPSAAPTIASVSETAVSQVSDQRVRADAGETVLSERDEAERAPATTAGSPEPLAPAADATALASMTEASASVAEQTPPPATELSPRQAVEATELAAPGPLEELVSGADASRAAATVIPGAEPSERVTAPIAGATAVPGVSGAPATVLERAPRPGRAVPSRRALSIGIAAVALVLAGVGFFVGRGNAPENRRTITAPANRTIQSGGITISAPVAWARQAKATALPGLSLTNTLALAPKGSSGGFLAGNVARAWPTFLPSSFRRTVGERAVRRHEIVQLGRLSAFRYARLSPRGFDGVVTVYTVPQPKGATTIVACYGRASAPELSKCDAIAASLQLANAEPYPLEPSTQYAAVLNSAFRPLDTARKRALSALRSATTQRQQAAAADTVKAAYGRAVRRLRGAKPTAYVRPAHARILGALQRTQNSYARLAGAARSGDRGRYDGARRLIRTNEATLDREVARLKELGYRL